MIVQSCQASCNTVFSSDQRLVTSSRPFRIVQHLKEQTNIYISFHMFVLQDSII